MLVKFVGSRLNLRHVRVGNAIPNRTFAFLLALTYGLGLYINSEIIASAKSTLRGDIFRMIHSLPDRVS